ncbi:MAG: major facilitator superfamily 1 [Candidatus Solibacter sp.]|nr:major facilitator superfamily 1 [Candidatus Solibacter sp.]
MATTSRIAGSPGPAIIPGAGEGEGRRWAVIALLSLGMIIAYASRSNLSVALVTKDFLRTFHLSDTDRGLLNSAFFWAYAALQIPAGWVVDRYGVKWPYALSFLFWCLASAGTAMAGTVGQLIAVRILLGVGESVVAPASYRWIRLNFAERRRGLAVGLYMTGTKIGPAIGTPLAAWLIGHYDWRAMFLMVGLGGLIWLIPWMLLVNDTPRGAARGAAAPAGKPVDFARVLASPVTWGTVIATFSYMYFVYFCMTWMPAYFMERRHLSLSQMGLYTFFSFGGMAIVAALAGWGADLMIGRGGNPVTVRKWFTIAGFAIACTELIGAQSSSVPVALTFSVISLSGLGLATANYWALTQTLIPASAIGRISGVQNCAASVAGIVAPILTGWLKQKTGSYEAPMMACCVFLVAGVLAYIFMVKERYAPQAEL